MAFLARLEQERRARIDAMPGTSLTDETAHNLASRFLNLFATPAHVFKAPGRVNLIGEHTDYNDGFVMPAAVGFFTWVAASPRNDRKLVVHSDNFGEQLEFSLDDIRARGGHEWSDYVLGVAKMVGASGRRIPGANLLIHGNVPLGAGLSSSASLEVAVASAFLDVSKSEISLKDLSLLCQRAENEFVGARCGIMDQFVASHGKQDQALLLDCRSLDYRLLPMPEEVQLVICNTMVRHSLAAGEYNKRRAECEEGVRILAKHRKEIRALRDATLDDLDTIGPELSDVVLRRCRHVISENARVAQMAEALERGDLKEVRNLMHESHRSLMHDFEVSCAELDAMVYVAGQVEGVYGARMTGGGFGGCTINLVRTENVETFKAHVSSGYQKLTNQVPEIYVCFAVDGVQRVA
jgi:galactokinase